MNGLMRFAGDWIGSLRSALGLVGVSWLTRLVSYHKNSLLQSEVTLHPHPLLHTSVLLLLRCE